MNNTRRSTPPNPSLDLPIRSTSLNKTLGTIRTHHEESIAKFNPTKTCPNKRNRRNPAKNSSNPRTLKTKKIEPLNSQIWEGNHSPKNHKGFPRISPSNPQEQGPENRKKTTKRGLRKSPPRTTGNNTTRP
jgi:hypothetical protein